MANLKPNLANILHKLADIAKYAKSTNYLASMPPIQAVPIFQVDWSGQVRTTFDDATSRPDASREHSEQQSIQLREDIQQFFRRQPQQQRGVFFPSSATNLRTQGYHQEEGSTQEQFQQCRLGEGVGYGQWMSSRLESSGDQCTSGETNVQNVRIDCGTSLQDRRDHPHHAPEVKGVQEQQLQAEEEQMSFQSLKQIGLESPMEQTVKRGVRKRILGELKSRIHELENDTSAEQPPCQEDLSMMYHLKTIGEVFSVPRFTARAHRHGLQAGRAFDLELGDDFLDPKKRQKCIQHLRDEEYGLVTVSSPCTLFSNLQFLALGKSKDECFRDPNFMAKYKNALTLLTFGVTVCQLQHDSNRYFLFEQPWNASSWKTFAVKRLINLPGVHIARTDQCAFGMSDPAGQPIRKRTGFATNSSCIARNLRRDCKGDHEHTYCVGSVKGISRATHASKYTNRLVDAVLRGFVQQLQHHSEDVPSHVFLSALWQHSSPNSISEEELLVHYLFEEDTVTNVSSRGFELYHIDLWATDEEDVIREPQEEDESAEIEPSRRRSLMKEIEKAHRGLGHPSKERFLRILRAGRASSLIQALAKTYECSQCREEQRPKPWRRAAPPRELSFNEVVGVDTLTLKFQEHRIQCLNCICWGTRYQMIIPLKEGTAAHVREAYRQWIKLFGAPKVVKPDLGREFLQEFAYRCGTDGSTVDPSSLEAPTQAAITEREGKSFKMIFAKASIELGRSLSLEEIHELIDITCMTKNRLTHKSGYSAIHRVFGFTPCMPGEFMQGNDGNFMNASANIQGDVQLQLQEQMRLAAGRAFFSAECHDALKRAIASGHRKLDNFQIGQEVFFWSVGVHRKVSHPNSASRKPNNQMWHGPAHILAIQHPSTLFLNYQGKLVKAAPEQCRMCSADETAACSELLSKLCQVRDRLQGHSVAGMFDITGQDRPATHEEHPTGKKRALVKQPPIRKRTHYQTDRPMGIKRPFDLCDAQEPIDLDATDDKVPIDLDASDIDLDINLDEPYEPTTPSEDEDMNLWLKQCWHVSLSSEDTDWWVEQCWNASLSSKDQKGGKEIRFKDLDDHDQQLFREAIMKEWNTKIEAGAVSVLSPDASRNIRQRLPHRIMQSRLLLTAKPVEDESQLEQDKRVHCSSSGQCCKAKARWIARGDKDPDVFQVESSSPVISRDSFFLGLQIIASKRWKMHFADFSQAFMQGGQLSCQEPLYCEMPHGGPIDGMNRESLIEIHKTVYGLTDAPFAWNRHLDQELQSLGYVPHVLDPCFYTLFTVHEGRRQLEGVIMLATDDLIDAGSSLHQQQMMKLKAKYKFGKWEYTKGRFCGKDLEQQSDCSITISQEYYSQLYCKQPIHIPRGSSGEEACNPEQIQILRTKLGILSWLCKETRVDLAGAVALLMQCMPQPKISDLKRCNQILRDAYLYRDIHIKIRPIPLESLAVVVSSDAAWGNACDEDGKLEKSQAGYLVMLANRDMLDGSNAEFSIVAWKSHTLKRKTVSTLGAESQAIVESAAVASWFRFFISECIFPQERKHHLNWEEHIQNLQYGLVTDAKSVYDALSRRGTISTSDKRTNIDLALVREILQKEGGCIRWIDGRYQLADSLTKYMPADFLRAVMTAGRYQLQEEYDTLQLRHQAKKDRQARKEATKAQKKVESM